ncbi:D-hexose-6-phosphate mutarotase [Aeromonas schubertii]|uniref:Putative glucose-6-phosphate 1-epimerase n=1 Tax=Aeromonas schubertii TaxID=652 RepID=A0A0S2SEJ1_9GAMM|nr:D-hexose-6-phosphate mutarotase [Aeromonas schubertii]ALP40126.1 Aldose 1-epimerase family protein [Aeromonas schubertii]KUE79383.1 D-hexose-6-phosphate mutarotase [Aeromonas schubertii]MBZ6066813.1 D-hexose-6-phosphate mutarotase [Aeromonas schubertii]MBZ6074601.1 D-hexose-6-phosphate mutarotase [Aeromonas schubertii]QCG49068.1 D-hexose-6-phosphate mutarotase [Aeromonas schubertii]
MLTDRTLTRYVTQTRSEAGLPLLTINNEVAHCEISLYGGHVLTYGRHGETPLIWLSDKALLDGSKPIRGGIPLCWPWFGPAPARVGSGKPSHGFARTSLWTLDGVSDHEDGTLVHLSLRDSDATRALWDHNFELELDILVGRELSLVLTTRNTGETPLVYNGALHTYLQVGAPEQVSVIGLGEPYLDKLSNEAARQQGPLPLTAAMDRIYQAPEAVVKVRDGDRCIEVVSGNHDSVVVWNPWREGAAAMADMSDDGYRTMLCVEAAITAEAGITVEPDEEHSLSTVIL